MEQEYLKILLIEDDEEDYFLFKRALSKIVGFKYSLEWVPQFDEGFARLLAKQHDIYIVDYRLGPHTGFELLDKVCEVGFDRPIIMLTGIGDEELGAQAIRKGAEDYLEKGQITGQLLQRSIHYSVERSKARRREQELVQQQAVLQARKQGEVRFKALIENTYDVILISDREGNYFYASPSVQRVLGYTPEEFTQLNGLTIVHPEDIARIAPEFEKLISIPRFTSTVEMRGKTKSGEWRWFECTSTSLFDEPVVNGIVTSLHDITERKRLERQKDDFVGIATHELKTPVTSIKAYAQVLQKKFLRKNDKVTAEYLSKMDYQLDKLNKLIGDLLDITKIEGGRLQFEQEKFDANSLVLEIVESLERTTDQHKISSELGETEQLLGDRDRIGQVLTNLISNAIKYSPASDKIIITTERKGDEFVFSVQDFGLGIPKDKQDKVFEKFFRISDERRETFPGMGLGLYISAEIVERHRGRLWVESEEGSGSTFCFSLPVLK